MAKHRFVERKGELRKQKSKLEKSKTLSKKKTLIRVTPDALTVYIMKLKQSVLSVRHLLDFLILFLLIHL